MSTDNADNLDEDDVAGHFQLPSETFDDGFNPTPREPAPPAATIDDDDVAGHFRSRPRKSVDDDGDGRDPSAV